MDAYEKKYRDLVKAVKELQDANPSDEGIQKWVKDNVPELKESEDERIRKEIIIYLKRRLEMSSSIPAAIGYWIAWLEKLCEQSKTLQTDNVPYESSPDAHLWTRAICFDGEPMESKPCEQKSSWSEDDKQYLEDTLTLLEGNRSVHTYGEVKNWLKSIKDRVQPQSHWKPSDEQMEALNDVISSRDIKYDVLSELWQDLKKLKEIKL